MFYTFDQQMPIIGRCFKHSNIWWTWCFSQFHFLDWWKDHISCYIWWWTICEFHWWQPCCIPRKLYIESTLDILFLCSLLCFVVFILLTLFTISWFCFWICLAILNKAISINVSLRAFLFHIWQHVWPWCSLPYCHHFSIITSFRLLLHLWIY